MNERELPVARSWYDDGYDAFDDSGDDSGYDSAAYDDGGYDPLTETAAFDPVTAYHDGGSGFGALGSDWVPPATPAHRAPRRHPSFRRILIAALALAVIGGVGFALAGRADPSRPVAGPARHDDRASRGDGRAEAPLPGGDPVPASSEPASPGAPAAPGATASGPSVTHSAPASTAATPGSSGGTAAGPEPAGTSTTADRVILSNWQVTVYYTAVEAFHTDAPVDVVGCLVLECANGDKALGRYPESFVDAVHDEGSGRITTGTHAGRYLNWSYDVGFWLDDAPRDSHGRALIPFRSAAADGVPAGTQLRLVDCGTLDSGETVPSDVCQKLSSGQWEIRDEFTPTLGGERHIDLYIGEEDRANFTSSALFTTLEGAAFAQQL